MIYATIVCTLFALSSCFLANFIGASPIMPPSPKGIDLSGTNNINSYKCKNIGSKRVEYDVTCSKHPDMIGCNAGGQGMNCRFCGFSVYHACPGMGVVETSPVAHKSTTIFEGDILLIDKTPQQFVQSYIVANNALQALLDAGIQNDAIAEFFRNAVKDRTRLWPNATLPFEISLQYTDAERNVILNAMRILEEYTCIRFVQRRNETDYLTIFRGDGCFSYLGRYGGVQPVSLGYGCVYLGTAMHELLHAVGFYHEQSRDDRDDYVTVHWENIINGTQLNFQKYTLTEIDHLGQPYDYTSLMHYDKLAFSKNGQPTIVPKQPGIDLIHSALKTVPSIIDAKKVNILYRCPEIDFTTTTTQPTATQPETTQPETTTSSQILTVATVPPSDCKDISPYCISWQQAAHCSSNPVYMQLACQLSCNACDSQKLRMCIDHNAFCDSWHIDGQCEKSPEFMRVVCPLACGVCTNKCVNDNYEPKVTYAPLHSGRAARSYGKVPMAPPDMPPLSFLR